MSDFVAATDRATPGLERGSVGAWVLRNARGETGRANSATAHGDPGMAIDAAVDRVEAWFLERDRVPTFQVYDETPAAVVAELDTRGYVTGAITDVLSAPAEAVATPATATSGWTVEVVASMPPFLRRELAEARAVEMLCADLPRWFVIASQGGAVLASGMAIGDGDLVGVFAMRTHPDEQGRGAGSAVLGALVAEGRRRGATTAWLQVEASNRRAADWYARLGFERRTGYRYRRLPDTANSLNVR